MSGNLLGCSKGVKDPFEVPEAGVISLETPQLKWASSLMEGKKLTDFLEFRQVLSTYDGDFRDPLWWPQERPVPMRLARGPLGAPLPSMPGPKTLCGVGAGT